MSNEYKDCLIDRVEEAKEWVAKYPFLRIEDNSCCPWENTEEIESCWMFDLPVGWQIGFGAQMCDELMSILGEYVDDFIILQLKEKYNSICLYWGWKHMGDTNNDSDEMRRIYFEIEDVIYKYRKISSNTCVACGKPATKYTKSGWHQGFCSDCYSRFR